MSPTHWASSIGLWRLDNRCYADSNYFARAPACIANACLWVHCCGKFFDDVDTMLLACVWPSSVCIL
jgi:hypothetical protein